MKEVSTLKPDTSHPGHRPHTLPLHSVRTEGKDLKLTSKAMRATPINIIFFKKLKAGKKLTLHLF